MDTRVAIIGAGPAGLLLGHRASAFSLDPRAPHVLEPKRRAPGAPAPALCVQDEGRVMMFGSGDPQVDLQIAVRIADGVGLLDAIEAPRLCVGDGNRLHMEDRFDLRPAGARNSRTRDQPWRGKRGFRPRRCRPAAARRQRRGGA